MPTTDEPLTPYAQAVASLQAGASEADVTLQLRARGLDEEGVRLLLGAARARGSSPVGAGGLPTSDWELAPVASTPDPEAAPRPGVPEPSPVELGACARCGSFLQPGAVKELQGRRYCATCAARPDVDRLGAFREAQLGRRDEWAWFLGVLGFQALVTGVTALALAPSFGAVVTLLQSGVYLAYWNGVRAARPLLLVSTALAGVAGLAEGRPLAVVFPLVVAAAALASSRGKLFFRMELSEDELERAWRSHHHNRPALWGRALAIGALLGVMLGSRPLSIVIAPALGLPAAVLGAIGLSRVDPHAVPPVGQRGWALFALVGGLLSVLATLVALWPLVSFS